MKKRIAGLILMMSCFSASVSAQDVQPTQMVPNNYERLEAVLKEHSSERNTLKDITDNTSSTYEFSFESNDGKYSILADNVPITLPEKDTMPAYYVNSGAIPQEVADRLFDYFFPNGAFTWAGTDFTKDVCAEMILDMKNELEQLKTEDTQLSEEQKEEIQNLERMIAEQMEIQNDLPEESTLRMEPTDSTYVDQTGYTYEGTEISQTLYAMSEDQVQYLLINSPDEKSVGWPTVRYSNEREYHYGGTWGTPVRKCSDDEMQEIGISLEGATDLVKDFVEKMDFQWDINEIMCVKGRNGADEWDEAGQYNAFKFVMNPCVDGITNAVTSSYAVRDKADESYHDWLYEMINIVVDADGIARLEWEFPLTAEKKISEDVEVISFDDASDIFEQLMPMIINDNGERRGYAEANVNVTNVKLELMRVRKDDSDRTGMLIPTWVFYGDFNYHHIYDDGTDYWGEEQQPWILLAINAVDGSVIDIVEGY